LTLPLDVGGTRFEDRLLKGSDVIRLFPINADDAGASVTEVAAARRKDPSGLLGAEFPIEMIGQGPGTDQGEEALLALAENLRRAGCDIVALPPVSSGADWERRASLGERLRCEVGLACLGRWEYQDLDRATTDLLAGRCDLIELVDARSDAPTHLAVMRA
jgi:hypothetical protein